MPSLQTIQTMPKAHDLSSLSYVLVTAAYNEEEFIERALKAVVDQVKPPKAWVIVSDGSTDRTDVIVQSYARQYDFIRLLRRERTEGRNFGSKVRAVHAGFNALRREEYDLIGNLDADVSFSKDYFKILLECFALDDRLGIAGGWICEHDGIEFLARDYNNADSVPHAIHLMRRTCYDQIGDYLPLKYGGEDTCAVVTARMRGWSTRSFPDLPVFHHRRTASAGWVLRNRFRRGLMDYSLGYHPPYAAIAYLRRSTEPPYILGTVLQFAGYAYGCCKRESRIVSPEFVNFLRDEQRSRLRRAVRKLIAFEQNDVSA